MQDAELFLLVTSLDKEIDFDDLFPTCAPDDQVFDNELALGDEYEVSFKRIAEDMLIVQGAELNEIPFFKNIFHESLQPKEETSTSENEYVFLENLCCGLWEEDDLFSRINRVYLAIHWPLGGRDQGSYLSCSSALSTRLNGSGGTCQWIVGAFSSSFPRFDAFYDQSQEEPETCIPALRNFFRHQADFPIADFFVWVERLIISLLEDPEATEITLTHAYLIEKHLEFLKKESMKHLLEQVGTFLETTSSHMLVRSPQELRTLLQALLVQYPYSQN